MRAAPPRQRLLDTDHAHDGVAADAVREREPRGVVAVDAGDAPAVGRERQGEPRRADELGGVDADRDAHFTARAGLRGADGDADAGVRRRHRVGRARVAHRAARLDVQDWSAQHSTSSSVNAPSPLQSNGRVQAVESRRQRTSRTRSRTSVRPSPFASQSGAAQITARGASPPGARTRQRGIALPFGSDASRSFANT